MTKSALDGAAFVEHPEIAERFAEIHPPFATSQAAKVEADRCLYCFDAPCMVACPTHIDVPRFIKKIAGGNLRGSANAILEANVLAASCARVCPVDVLCEGACVMNRHNEKPIEIGRLQRFAMEAFLDSGEALPQGVPAAHRGRFVMIGAGPASLACAAELRQHGHEVDVFDKQALPGGLNTYGVAEYKLRTVDSLREIALIEKAGAKFHFNTEINPAVLTTMEQEHDAIFLGVGLGNMHQLGLAGEELDGVVNALDFIAEYKTGVRLQVPDSVVVIGAGNTAIDAANAARRLGATQVRILYRRGEADMPAFSFEYKHARQEGVSFHWHTQPVAIQSEAGAVSAVEVTQVEWRKGRMEHVEGSKQVLACGMIIPAIGQSPVVEFLSEMRGLKTEKGRIVVDRPTGRTSLPKYFAGGDCVNGGREVVDAVADGKRAATAMMQDLELAHA